MFFRPSKLEQKGRFACRSLWNPWPHNLLITKAIEGTARQFIPNRHPRQIHSAQAMSQGPPRYTTICTFERLPETTWCRGFRRKNNYGAIAEPVTKEETSASVKCSGEFR